MSLLSGLFSNESVKKLAFSSLKKIMKEENLHSILITANDQNREGTLPGFDLQVFKNPVSVFDTSIVGLTSEQWVAIQQIFELCEESKDVFPDMYDRYKSIIATLHNKKENELLPTANASGDDNATADHQRTIDEPI